MTHGQRVLLAAVLICAGGASGFFAAHVAHRPTQILSEIPDSRAAVGRRLPDTDDAGAPEQPSAARVIPTNLPSVTLKGTDGIAHSLADWKGRPLLINFWATWCAPCRREIPLLQQLRRERAAEGVEVIGIAVDFRDAVRQYARDMHIDYPILVGEQDGLEAIAAFGMDTVFPFTVFVDRQGRIVTLKVGELHPDEARLILDRLNEIDQGRLELANARKEIAGGMAELSAQRAKAEEAADRAAITSPDPRQ